MRQVHGKRDPARLAGLLCRHLLRFFAALAGVAGAEIARDHGQHRRNARMRTERRLNQLRPETYLHHGLLAVCFAVIHPALTLGQNSSAGADESACEELQSNNTQDECVEQELKHSEQEMLSTYKRLEIALNLVSDPQERKELEKLPKYDREHELMWSKVTLKRLRKSQALWRAYRDSTCAAYAAQFEEGNITGKLVPMCKTELTQQRTKWLQDAFR